MDKKLYEYQGILWEFHQKNYNVWVAPFCPIHKMELSGFGTTFKSCEDCNKVYRWKDNLDVVAHYLRRKLSSVAYQEAKIISIDGIQTPLLKTRVIIPDENAEYWVEARLNKSNKGRQIVIYVGEKGSAGKAQLFINSDQEKLSFDHKDRKPEDIFTTIIASFPSGKQMSIVAPKKVKK